MNDLIPFNFEFENERIRVIKGKDKNPWFVAGDVARLLKYDQPHKAIKAHCKYGMIYTINQNGRGTPKMKIIPQSDVLRLIVKSRLPQAESIEQWIFEQVIPSVLQKGNYGLDNISRKDLAKMLWESETEKEKLAEQAKQQQEELKQAAPKVEYHDKVLQTNGAMTVTQMAAEWGYSAKQLNLILHQLEVQYKQSGQWILYQKHKNKGYVDYRTYAFTNIYGEEKTTHYMVWTEKGKKFVHQMLKQKNYI